MKEAEKNYTGNVSGVFSGFNPDDLRRVAQALSHAADDCERGALKAESGGICVSANHDGGISISADLVLRATSEAAGSLQNPVDILQDLAGQMADELGCEVDQESFDRARNALYSIGDDDSDGAGSCTPKQPD